jgi:hypothetical protein
MGKTAIVADEGAGGDYKLSGFAHSESADETFNVRTEPQYFSVKQLQVIRSSDYSDLIKPIRELGIVGPAFVGHFACLAARRENENSPSSIRCSWRTDR